MAQHRVIVTAVGGNIGQGVIKALRASKRTFAIVGVDMEPLSAGFSLCERYHAVPRTGAPGFAERFQEIALREQIEGIYVCSPTELDFFSTQRAALQDKLRATVFVNPPRAVQIGRDKLRAAEFLRDAGFPHPDTIAAADDDRLRAFLRKHPAGVVVKPRFGSSSHNVAKVTTLEAGRAAITLTPDAIVQEYVGDESAEYTATTLAGEEGRVRASIILRRDLLQGTTYRTELAENAAASKQIAGIAEALGTVGVCNFQFRLVDGRVVVFDINPRFSGTTGIRYRYGFNDPEMVFELLHLGHELSQPALHRAVVLRYWNEIYIEGTTFAALRDGARCHDGTQTMVDGPQRPGTTR